MTDLHDMLLWASLCYVTVLITFCFLFLFFYFLIFSFMFVLGVKCVNHLIEKNKKLKIKKKTCWRSLQKWSEIELYSRPLVLSKSSTDPTKPHMKFTGKNKVSNTT